MFSMNFLEVHNLTKSFGGILALNGLNLQVQEREILGIIGPNGAGKSTLFNVITGVFAPNNGEVLLRGRNITGLKPHAIARRGIGRSFQINTLFMNATVMDNVRVGFHLLARRGVKGFFGIILRTPLQKRSEKAIDDKVLKILSFVGMEHLRDMPAQNLSYGYQRTLAMAISLASEPQLLLLDEPVTALSPERVAAIMDLIRSIRDQGTTVIMVEHNMRAIFTTCDRIVVMNYGQNLAEGTPEEVRENRDVIEAYLGRRQSLS
jgi:branched-chain amino acid transport system ATP-binding protein